MKKSAFIPSVVIISTVSLASAGVHGALFGAQSDTGRIVEVDPTSGAVVRSLAAPDAGFREVGLTGAENGSVLLWQDITGETTMARTTRIDPFTGAVLSYHDAIYPGGRVGGLASERIGGVDYILNGGRNSFGVTVQQGYGGPLYSDFGFDAATHTIGGDGFGRSFAACFDQTIREFDTLSGNVLNTMAVAPPVDGLAFDGTYLYASSVTSNGSPLLYTLDPNTAAVIRVVPVQDGRLYDLGVAVPEPAIGLLLAGLIGLAMRR